MLLSNFLMRSSTFSLFLFASLALSAANAPVPAERTIHHISGRINVDDSRRRLATLSEQTADGPYLFHFESNAGFFEMQKYFKDRYIDFIPEYSWVVYATHAEVLAFQQEYLAKVGATPGNALIATIPVLPSMKFVRQQVDAAGRDPQGEYMIVVTTTADAGDGPIKSPTLSAEDSHELFSVTPQEAIFKVTGKDVAKLVDHLSRLRSVIAIHVQRPAKIPDVGSPDADADGLRSLSGTERQREATAQLAVGNSVLQSGATSLSYPLWNQGLYGHKQLIGIADTGLDYYHCNFINSDKSTPTFTSIRSDEVSGSNTGIQFTLSGTSLSKGTAAVTASSVAADTSRKVASYIYRYCTSTPCQSGSGGVTDVADIASGHGTHVVGCAAGLPQTVQDAHACLAWSGTSAGCKSAGVNAATLKATFDSKISTAATTGFAVGGAPAAKVVFVDLSEGGSALTLPAGDNYRTNYLQPIFDLGAYVMSFSLGTPAYDGSRNYQVVDYTAESRAVDTFVWNNPTAIPLFAAGNEGELNSGVSTIASPGNAKNPLSIGAMRHTSGTDTIARFSSRGPTVDGRFKPDVCAPGVFIWAAKSPGTTSGSVMDSGTQTCELVQKHGTSMATPMMAGNVALLRQYFMEGYYPSGSAVTADAHTNAQLTAAIVKSVVFVSAVPEKTNTNGKPDNLYGIGEPNLASALMFGHASDLASASAASSLLWVNSGSHQRALTSSESTHVYCFTTKSTTANLRIALTWTDYPSGSSAQKQLYTDLDLIVVNTQGDTWRGNGGSTSDSLNNNEVIQIQSPAATNYKVIVTVKSMGVSSGSFTQTQLYGLAVLGPLALETSAYDTSFPRRVIGPNSAGSSSTLTSLDAAKCPPNICSSNCSIGSLSSTAYTAANAVQHSSTSGSLSRCDTSGALPTCVCNPTTTGTDCSATISSCVSCGATNSHGCMIGGVCVCHRDSVNGYWTGSNCDQCLTEFAPDPGAAKSCFFEKALCSSRGTITTSGCTCKTEADYTDKTVDFPGAFGGDGCLACEGSWSTTQHCKCRKSDCDGKGTCATSTTKITGGDATGYCSCTNDDTNGHWGGYHDLISPTPNTLSFVSCRYCDKDWAGTGCLCPRNNVGGVTNYAQTFPTAAQVCGGHGVCSATGCTCDASSTVQSSSVTLTSGNTNNQVAKATSTVTREIAGFWTGTGCIQCATGYTGSKCLCKITNGKVCSGNGDCSANGCVCYANATAGYWGSSSGVTDCDVCDSSYRGVGNTNNAGCNCKAVFKPGTTEIAHLCGSSDPLQKNGECTSSGCSCYTNSSTGYWAGAGCEICHADWVGPSGKTTADCRCPKWNTVAQPLECDGHGYCAPSGCRCDNTPLKGYWTANGTSSDNCKSCLPGYQDATSNTNPVNCSCSETSCVKAGSKGTCKPYGCMCFASASTGFWGPQNAAEGRTASDPTLSAFASEIGNAIVGPDCFGCAPGYSPTGSCTCNLQEGCAALEPTVLATTSFSYSALAEIFLGIQANTFTSFTAPTLRYEATSVSSITANTSLVFAGTQFALNFATGGSGRENQANVMATADATAVCANSIALPTPITVVGRTRINDSVKYFPGQTEFFIKLSDSSPWVPLRETHASCSGLPNVTQDTGFSNANLPGVAATQYLVSQTLCCFPITAGGSTFEGRAQLALFAIKDDSVAFPIALVAGGSAGAFALFLLIFIVAFIIINRLRKSAAERRSREAVIKYMLARKDQSGNSLRRQLKLSPGEKFTPQFAASRVVWHAERARKLVTELKQKGVISAAPASPTASPRGAPPPRELTQALSELAAASLPKSCTLQPDDSMLSCARKLREKFDVNPDTKEFALRPNSLPPIQLELTTVAYEVRLLA